MGLMVPSGFSTLKNLASEADQRGVGISKRRTELDAIVV